MAMATNIFRLCLPALALAVCCTVSALAETAPCQELKNRVEQLEGELRALRAQAPAGRPAGVRQVAVDDPLVGTWRCTNKVFTYDMTFFADGLLLQESTTLGPMRELTWVRTGDDELLLTGGTKLRFHMAGRDRATAENMGTRTKWECEKLLN